MNDVVEKAATSAWFTLVGRGFMILTPVLVVPMLSWAVNSLVTLNTKVEVLSATVAFNMSDRYRGDDAKRDFQLRDLRLDALQMRISDLEHEVRSNKIDLKTQEQKLETTIPRRR